MKWPRLPGEPPRAFRESLGAWALRYLRLQPASFRPQLQYRTQIAGGGVSGLPIVFRYSGYDRLGAPARRGGGEAVPVRDLVQKRVGAGEVVRHGCGRRRDFGRRLADVASHLLRRIEHPRLAAHERFGEDHGIGDDGLHRQVIPVPDPVFGERALVARRDAVPADVVLFEVGRVDVQHVVLPRADGEARPGVGRVRRRARPAIEVESSAPSPEIPCAGGTR